MSCTEIDNIEDWMDLCDCCKENKGVIKSKLMFYDKAEEHGVFVCIFCEEMERLHQLTEATDGSKWRDWLEQYNPSATQ